jgi:hypothetical protein
MNRKKKGDAEDRSDMKKDAEGAPDYSNRNLPGMPSGLGSGGI